MAQGSPETKMAVNGSWKLPEDWEWIPLERVCAQIVGGGTPDRSRSEYFGGDIVWITPTDLTGSDPSYKVTNSRTTLTSSGLQSSSASIIPTGAVLFSSRASIGKIAIAAVPLSTNQGFVNFICNDRLNNNYLAWCLRALVEEIKKLAGSTTYLEVSRGSLRHFAIPIPMPNAPQRSLDIQSRIVARIEAIMTEVKRARTLVDEMNLYVEELMITSVNEVITKIEQTTNGVALSSVATAFNGRASGEGNSKVRVFKTKHVYPHFLRLDKPSFMKAEQVNKLPKDRFLRSGDVLMANIAEGTLGRVTYVHECEDLWTVDTQIMILRPLNDQELLGKWLYYYLWSGRGQKSILARRSGIAFAEKRGQTHIYPKNVLEISLPVPPVEYQKQVITYLDSMQSEVNEMKRLLNQDAELLDQMEQSILERAFRGEL